MVQIIQNTGSRGSRIGARVGEALSEQLPKEAARYRLSQGLQEVGQMQNQSPFQQFASLAGVPGITPQMLESGAELLKQQRFRDAYRGQGQAGQPSEQPQQSQQGQNFQDVQFAQMPNQIQRGMQAPTGEQPQVAFDSREQQALANPPSAAEHPGQEKYQPAKPWNQAMQDSAISEAFDSGKAINLQEAMSYANQQRQMYEAAPEAERARYNYNKEIDTETENLFNTQLAKRLQKAEGQSTFADVPGDLQLNLVKQAQNSVSTGKMTPKQAAEYYSTAALDLTKTLNNAKRLANVDVLDLVDPKKKAERIKNLMTMGKEFSELGASEYFYDFLKTKGKDAKGNYQGFGLSPGMASLIAFPISQSLEKIVNDADFPLIGYEKRQQEANRVADQVLNAMSPNDSILAVARQLKDKHPNFDEMAFFDYVREHPEMWSFNKRLGREVQTGVSDIFPNWGDILLFPANKKITSAHRSRK